MVKGQIFQQDQSFWMADEVILETNACFKWFKVKASWSQFGPRPLWATKSRTFFMDRRRYA